MRLTGLCISYCIDATPEHGHTGQAEGDGEPTCFSTEQDTSIPELQQWCHKLTTLAWEHSACKSLARLRAFAMTVVGYLDEAGTTPRQQRTEFLRALLRRRKHVGIKQSLIKVCA
jgi:hypothetical protein